MPKKFLAAIFFLLVPALAQTPRRAPTLHTPTAPPPSDEANLPFKVYDTTPVMLHGPMLLEPSATTATIEWITDTPCAVKVVYGSGGHLDQTFEPQQDGFVPVGTIHRVELTGLQPGTTYEYQLVSTRVVQIKGYWPDMGHALTSPVYHLTTFDPSRSAIAFDVMTDTHEDVKRINALMKMVDWKTTDFLVHLGDGVNWAQTQDQVFQNWLDPITAGLGPTKPWLYARGNHDLRGPFARDLSQFLTTPDHNRYYYTRDDGPAHFIVVDTGEDKPDSTPVYAGLNNLAPYRAQELQWLQAEAQAPAAAQAAFRIVLMHQPYWGWLDGKNLEWTNAANRDHVDLVIAGHWHRFAFFPAGTAGNNFPVLVVGQDQLANVQVTREKISVSVTTRTGQVIKTFEVPRQRS